MLDQPKLWMLIGVVCSGKSTWIANHIEKFSSANTVIISSDDIIEQRAKLQGKTYSDIFMDEIKSATSEMYKNVAEAVEFNKDIIWDQTNLTPKVRAEKLRLIPEHYKKFAVFFKTPDEKTLVTRLNSRPGKIIPMPIVKNMINTLVPPTKVEGFDRIFVI